MGGQGRGSLLHKQRNDLARFPLENRAHLCLPKEIFAMTNTVVRARIDEHVKEEAAQLWLILGDGVNQAADLASGATSIPSWNLTPWMTFGNWF